jgi:hypothetical protein
VQQLGSTLFAVPDMFDADAPVDAEVHFGRVAAVAAVESVVAVAAIKQIVSTEATEIGC